MKNSVKLLSVSNNLRDSVVRVCFLEGHQQICSPSFSGCMQGALVSLMILHRCTHMKAHSLLSCQKRGDSLKPKLKPCGAINNRESLNPDRQSVTDILTKQRYSGRPVVNRQLPNTANRPKMHRAHFLCCIHFSLAIFS